MLYELPSTINNPIEFFQWINQLTGYLFGNVILLAFAMILFVSMKKSGNETNKSLMSTAFASFVVSFLLLIIGLVEVQTVMITFIAMISSVFLDRAEGRY